jgi:hypothetical protein
VARSVSFNVTYDAGSDVLYITARREAATRGREDRHGIVWRYGANGDLIGATVMDFREVWTENPEGLADELAARFDIPTAQALNVVEHALGGEGSA